MTALIDREAVLRLLARHLSERAGLGIIDALIEQVASLPVLGHTRPIEVSSAPARVIAMTHRGER